MQDTTFNCWSIHHSSYTTRHTPLIIYTTRHTPLLSWQRYNPVRCCELLILQGAQVRSACVSLEDAHVGENLDTPIGQFVLIGNFRRRLARELLVLVPRFQFGMNRTLVTLVLSSRVLSSPLTQVGKNQTDRVGPPGLFLSNLNQHPPSCDPTCSQHLWLEVSVGCVCGVYFFGFDPLRCGPRSGKTFEHLQRGAIHCHFSTSGYLT